MSFSCLCKISFDMYVGENMDIKYYVSLSDAAVCNCL